MRGQHHDGDDREETASLQGDQGKAEAGQGPVQARQHAHPAQLEKDQRGQKIRPSTLLSPDHGLLGHGYLTRGSDGGNVVASNHRRSGLQSVDSGAPDGGGPTRGCLANRRQREVN